MTNYRIETKTGILKQEDIRGRKEVVEKDCGGIGLTEKSEPTEGAEVNYNVCKQE